MKKFAFALIVFTNILFAETDSFPALQNGRNFNVFAYGDFIYWRISSSNLVYGRDGVGLANNILQTEIPVKKTGTSFYPNFPYKPGYKVGVGFKFGPGKAFDLVANFVSISSNPKGSVSEKEISASFLPLIWLNSNTLASSVYHHASMALDLHYYFPEIQSGYTFSATHYLSLRPYIALSSIFVDGDLRVKYEFTTPIGIFKISKTHGECSSWSIGPKVGIDFNFHLPKNFGIYCNANFLTQATHVNMKSKEVEEQPAIDQKLVIQKGRLTENRTVGLFNLEIGPTWDQWFDNQKYRFQIRTTWQTLTFINGTNLSFINNNNMDIDMTSEIRGLNIRATFEF